MDAHELAAWLTATIREMVAAAPTVTRYRPALVSWAAASDPRWAQLKRLVSTDHRLPADLLPGARSVVSFFVPFAPNVPAANAEDHDEVAVEWVRAYVETNALIDRITAQLVALLAERGIRAVAEPATHKYDRRTMTSDWSHKSAAVITGLGSFGLHHLIITDAGCAGRLGSLVLDADLPPNDRPARQRCLYFIDGSCLECVLACPVYALDEEGGIDKHTCSELCHANGELWAHLGQGGVCGKCSTGPCALESAVAD